MPEKFRDGPVFHWQIRITVEHEKFIAEQRHRAFDGAARAQQFRAVERIIQPDAKRAAIAKIALDHLAEITEAQYHAADAAGMEQFELVRQKRFARDGHERFGDFFRDGAQARGESAGEDGHGNVERCAHEMTSLVPSKSKRKRTSLSPARVIA